jgi:hypothetical protein
MVTLREELRRVRAIAERRDESANRQFVEEQFVPLALDGLQKAEQTLSQSRIRRIAAILAHAYEVGPAGSIETAEEMMVAMLLSDEEVLVLRTVYEGQKGYYNTAQGRTLHEDANEFWRRLDGTHGSTITEPLPELRRFSLGTIQGICAKLQSLGLLVQVERNQMKLAPGFTPYAILAKAVDFVGYIRNS